MSKGTGIGRPQPNILLIMPDQLRADFLSCYGAGFIDTPNIDGLADAGVRFADASTPSPLCVPARSILLTGLNAIRTGVLSNKEYIRPDLKACGVKFWTEHLREAGYETAAIGKMHFYPWEASMGFDYRVICEDKRWLNVEDDYHHYLKERGLWKFHGNEHEGYEENRGAIVSRLPLEHSWDSFVGDEAVKYLRDRDGAKPFAAMVGFPGPHCPYDPSPGTEDWFAPEDMPEPHPVASDQPKSFCENKVVNNRRPWNGVDYTVFTTAQKKKIRAYYASLVKHIDNKVGEMIEALRETGELENTVIIFFSDHGDYLGDHGMIGKGMFHEASIKVPLIVHLPWAREGTVREEPASIEDVTATVMRLAGCEIPDFWDSRPLPLKRSESGRDRVFGFLDIGCMIYDGEWKLTKYSHDGGVVQLFNIREDPGEQRNRADDPACFDIYRRLDTELSAEMVRSVHRANAEKLLDTGSDDDTFGRKGWQRSYPQAIG